MRTRVISLCVALVARAVLAADHKTWQALEQELVKLTARGEYRAALPVARQALEEARGFGTEDPRFVDSLISTGVLAHYLGQRKEAEETLLKGISLVQGRPGREEVLARLLDNLATCYYEYGGRNGEVEALRREALDLAIRSQGPNHIRVSVLRAHLALSLIDRRRYDEAKAMLAQSLEVIDERTYPVSAGDSYMSLGSMAASQHQYPEAVRLFTKARAVFAEFGGESSPRLILPLLALAEVYLETKRVEEADVLLCRAIALADASLGPDNLRTAEILSVRVRALRALGKRQESRGVERRAKAIVALRAREWRGMDTRVHISDLGKQR